MSSLVFRILLLSCASVFCLTAKEPAPPQVTKFAQYRVWLEKKELAVSNLFTATGYGYQKLPVSYVDVSQDGTPEFVVETEEPITTFEWSPRPPGVVPVVKDNQLHFRPGDAPSKLGVRLNNHQWLFLFLNRPDPSRPSAGTPGVISLDKYGADATGKRVETATLQKAIDDAATEGKPTTVFIPHGIYRTGSLWMKSNVTLYLDDGAILQGEESDDAYPMIPYEHQAQWDASTDPQCHRALLWFHGIHDAALRGRGVLDGQGSLRRDAYRGKISASDPRTHNIRVVDCERIRLEDVVVRDSEFWGIHLLRSRDIGIQNIKIVNEMIYPGWDIKNPKSRWNNTDGLDVDACARVTIEDSFAYTGDDAFVIKTTNTGPTQPPPCEDILFRRCMGAASTMAFKFGTESVASAMRRITFEDLDVPAMNGAISLGFKTRDTATVEQIVFRKIRLANPDNWLSVLVEGRTPEQKDFVKIRDLSFEEIDLPKSPKGILKGRKDTDSLSGIHFYKMKVTGKAVTSLSEMGLQCTDAAEITIDGKPAPGPDSH